MNKDLIQNFINLLLAYHSDNYLNADPDMQKTLDEELNSKYEEVKKDPEDIILIAKELLESENEGAQFWIAGAVKSVSENISNELYSKIKLKGGVYGILASEIYEDNNDIN